jgi:hypothetical protein
MQCPEFVRLIRLRHGLHLHHAIHLAGDNPFGQLEIQAQIAAVITKDIYLKRKKLFPLCGISSAQAGYCKARTGRVPSAESDRRLSP